MINELNGGTKKYSTSMVERTTESKPGPVPPNQPLATTPPKKKNRKG